MPRCFAAAAAVAAALAASPPAARAAEPVMVQCGRAYQAAKAAGTLGGQDWTAFRTACAARLQASTAAPTPAAAPPAAPTLAPAAPPIAPTPAAAASGPATPAALAAVPAGGGMAAMHARQRQCGAEWTAGKATLMAETPGLTWPKYWSRCNARIKATGR